MPDHTGRGFWCEFCKDYHSTIECPHPALTDAYENESELSELRGELEQAEYRADKYDELMGELDLLLADYDESEHQGIIDLRKLVSKYEY